MSGGSTPLSAKSRSAAASTLRACMYTPSCSFSKALMARFSQPVALASQPSYTHRRNTPLQPPYFSRMSGPVSPGSEARMRRNSSTSRLASNTHATEIARRKSPPPPARICGKPRSYALNTKKI